MEPYLFPMDPPSCTNCLKYKYELEKVTQELLSARKIIQLLQEDINTDVDSTAVITSVNPHVSTNTNDNWELVAGITNNSKKSRIHKNPNQTSLEKYPISVVPITNRFDILYNLQNEVESTNDTWNHSANHQHPTEYQHNKKTALHNKNKVKRPPKAKRKRILLIGDSHVRGCSSELAKYLGQEYQVSGTFMPGSRLRNITKLAKKEITGFTKEDLVIIWGGANDVNKNDSIKGLRNLHEYVRQMINTNFMIVTIPHRHDLLDTSCVNNEVQKFNAKLHNIMKNKINVRILENSTIREDFTKHGLHLNASGKNKIAKLMSQNILHLPKDMKKHHIILGWTTSLHDTSTGINTNRIDEQVDDNKEGLTDSQIPSIIQDMGTSNIVNGIPHAANEEQIIIINKKPNIQGTADNEQMINNINKGRSEDLIDLSTQEIAEDKQMTITSNKVKSEKQIDLNTQETTKNEQVIIINSKVRDDNQIDLDTQNIRISTRPKRIPNMRRDDFLWS
jgi:lysophospholipase L1-like esterase